MGIPNAKPKQPCCPIVELRQYTLHPGKQHVLIDLFDREFIEPQEALGMRIINRFCERVSALLCENEFPKFVTTRGNQGQIHG